MFFLVARLEIIKNIFTTEISKTIPLFQRMTDKIATTVEDRCQEIANTHCGENVTIHSVFESDDKQKLIIRIKEKERIDYRSVQNAFFLEFKKYIKIEVIEEDEIQIMWP